MTGAKDDPGPMQAAQRAMRPQLPKRFYKEANVGEEGNAFVLLLDGKPARTPLKRPLALPIRKLTEIVVREWNEQAEEIDPGTMPMTRLANLAIDRVEDKASEMREEVRRYATSDLILYRASEPEGLVAEQKRHWEPVLHWASEQLDANFVLVDGVTFVTQPESALAAIDKEIERYPAPFSLAALTSITQLTGSALIALMLAHGRLTPVEAWNDAHVDEDWNARAWGDDAEAVARRTLRFSEFEAAAKMLQLTARRQS